MPCEEFHDTLATGSGFPPFRSLWPTKAEPPLLWVQLPQVVCLPGSAGIAVPSGREPVRTTFSRYAECIAAVAALSSLLGCEYALDPIRTGVIRVDPQAKSIAVLQHALAKNSYFFSFNQLEINGGAQPSASGCMHHAVAIKIYILNQTVFLRFGR